MVGTKVVWISFKGYKPLIYKCLQTRQIRSAYTWDEWKTHSGVLFVLYVHLTQSSVRHDSRHVAWFSTGAGSYGPHQIMPYGAWELEYVMSATTDAFLVIRWYHKKRWQQRHRQRIFYLTRSLHRNCNTTEKKNSFYWQNYFFSYCIYSIIGCCWDCRDGPGIKHICRGAQIIFKLYKVNFRLLIR